MANEVKQAEEKCIDVWGKTMTSNRTLKSLSNAMNKMMQHQHLSTDLCKAYELSSCNNYHVMALREFIRTANDIECGARDETTQYLQDTMLVKNRQVQQKGCTRGLEQGTWRAGARDFCSLENTGISIATLYHFWQHLGQAVEVSSAGEVNSTGEASNGGHVESVDVASGVEALVQIGNSKIATYGAAVQRCSGDRRRVLKAIVDRELYTSLLGYECSFSLCKKNISSAHESPVTLRQHLTDLDGR